MSYALAYTTHFHSLDNTPWEIGIYINGYDARPVEISLDGDEPCVIDWQETDKMDVVQSATCTLRVSNERDRQMVQLMNSTDAAILVSRYGKPYWWGYLDDAVYEEPYSFPKGYVTELPFTDFGVLNRIPFTLSGKQSVGAIVRDCLDSIGYGSGAIINLYTSLRDPKQNQPINLDMLYINADRFATDGDSWGKMTMKRDVLEEILRPLGLRIMQKNGQIFIYDIEYLRDHLEMQNYPVWKGTDAYLKGSETFGWYEVAFEPDTVETLAEDGLDYDSGIWNDSEKYFAKSYDLETETDSDIGFYLEVRNYATIGANIQKSSNARFFRTRSVFTDSNEIGVAWRIKCKEVVYNIVHNGHSIPVVRDTILLDNLAVCLNSNVEDVFWVETGYLPLAPDRAKYQLRVNLDFLISFRPNPFDDPADEWAATQDYPAMEAHWENDAGVNAYLVPVILDVLDDNGNAVYHYENADYETHGGDIYNLYATDVVRPFGINKGRWVAGAGVYGQMYLAYYNPDNNEDPLIEKDWVTNRIASPANSAINGTLYRVRDDGEYVSLPPLAGRLRLTVGNGIFVTKYAYYGAYAAMFYGPQHFAEALFWQLYRNPKITLVKADRREDGIDDRDVYERDMINLTADNLSETVKAGCWRKGVPPSSRGLFFDAYGIVWENFVKNGHTRTLEMHRLRSIEDQTFYAQPVISGTVEFDSQFCAKRERSTPGVFLVTALRQNLHQDTEELTMARIANEGGFCYDYYWGDGICVKTEAIPYNFAWGKPICAKELKPEWSFAWEKPICVKVEKKTDKDN